MKKALEICIPKTIFLKKYIVYRILQTKGKKIKTIYIREFCIYAVCFFV